MMKLFHILVIGLVLAQGCSKSNTNGKEDHNPVQTDDSFEKVNAILVDKTGFDGCRWVLQLKDGSFLEPTNLSDFPIELVNNKPVVVSYTIRHDMASICMVGLIVDIDAIRE